MICVGHQKRKYASFSRWTVLGISAVQWICCVSFFLSFYFACIGDSRAGIGEGTNRPIAVLDAHFRPEFLEPVACSGSCKLLCSMLALKKAAEGTDHNLSCSITAAPQEYKLQPELLSELGVMTDQFIQSAVDFGCELARRRKGHTLRAADLAVYMQRIHHVHVPGFNQEYKHYRRPAASALHKDRAQHVRKAVMATDGGAHGEGGGGGAKGGGEGGRGGAGGRGGGAGT